MPSQGWQGERIFKLHFTQHALRACLNDRYGPLKPSHEIKVTWDQIVEAEVTRGQWSKFVARLPYSQELDIIYVITAEERVKTVWANKVTDKHGTLGTRAYVTRF